MKTWRVIVAVVAAVAAFIAVGAARSVGRSEGQSRAVALLTPSPTAPTVEPTETTPSLKPTATRPVGRRNAAAVAWTGPAQPSATCGRTGERVVRFRVAVDRGLATTGERFARDVLSILCDERSWIASGHVRFRYDPNGSLLIGLRTDEHKDELCYPYTGYGSCQIPGQVVINADRWFGGSKFVPLTVSDYRRLVINHEVGHAIGQRHRGCAKDGAPAPVMMQQSLGLTTNGRTCRANPWPLSYELRTIR